MSEQLVRYYNGPLDGCVERLDPERVVSLRPFPSPVDPTNRIIWYKLAKVDSEWRYTYLGEDVSEHDKGGAEAPPMPD